MTSARQKSEGAAVLWTERALPWWTMENQEPSGLTAEMEISNNITNEYLSILEVFALKKPLTNMACKK